MEDGVTFPLAGEVKAAVGQPSSVRIGVVTQLNPLIVSVQGVDFENVGLAAGAPAVGDNVALLGQSPVSGSDPTSWLALGRLQTAETASQQTGRWLDGTQVGVVTLAGPVSAETNLAQLALSAPVVAGGVYLFHVQMRVTVTDAADDWQITLREDTALTGNTIGTAQFSGSNLLDTPYYTFPHYAVASGTMNYFFSIVRTAGVGTVTVSGAPAPNVARTWSGVQEVGFVQASGGVWRST
jgi:hypothetical protein